MAFAIRLSDKLAGIMVWYRCKLKLKFNIIGV